FEGTWSPDGRHVAFHRVEVGGDGLWVVPREGGESRRLADGGHSPAWSPDSTRILHSPSTEAAPVALAITDLTGTTTPVPDSAGGIDPAWSPDGTQIAYIDPARDFALVLHHLDSSDRTVTPGPATEPSWSPSSDRVAHIERRDEGPRLMLIDSAGSEAFFLTDRFARIQQLAYSPTGTQLVFAAAEQDGDQLALWTIRVDDGQLGRLTDDPADDFGPSWSASGESIAFTRTPDLSAGDAPRNVVVVPAAGGATRQVTDTGTDHTVAFAPGLTVRLAGADRIATAVTLSRTFDTAATAVIVRADDYPDALAAAPLAATVGGPILLTGRDELDPSVIAELARLGTQAVYLLGGHAALSPQVEEDLAAAGIADVTRLAGADRFATAARVLDELDALGSAFQRIFIVEGQHADPARGWPDALSAAGAAAHTLDPILLVTRDRVPAETAAALQVHADARVTIVGGTAAVSEAVAQQIEAVTASVERMPGADRYETATRAADLAVSHGASATHPWLVTGHDWPDALVAAPAVARDGGVLLLVDGRDPVGSAATHAWLPGRDTRRGVVVGGTTSITSGVRAAIESSLISGP
ncbi:MAG TPA: cell wall-binding repeat-containing protein, partial [Euzebya sp.]|nr:cell wall-binding repeat-containing protein [Euzebya sp.]